MSLKLQEMSFPHTLPTQQYAVSDAAIARENIQKHAVFITFCIEFEASGGTPSSLVFCLYFPVPNSSSSVLLAFPHPTFINGG